MRRKKILDWKAKRGVAQIKRIHDMEVADILETQDAAEMNELSRDPKQSLPRPRNDLPKNKHHESIHEM